MSKPILGNAMFQNFVAVAVILTGVVAIARDFTTIGVSTIVLGAVMMIEAKLDS
ncbi:MAG TPA: hypothetical protein VFM18_18155 [Methanosarcina sp.]|nr:hypothetical protein [Methanosarcina sp.]